MLASDILSFLSFFHFQAIPKDFMDFYYQQRDLEQTEGGTSAAALLVKALGTLKAFCFVLEREDKSLTMHRLVQLVTQKWVINEGQVAGFAKLAMKTMLASYPEGRFETREICLRYLPHANAVIEKCKMASDNDTNRAAATLLHNLSGYFFLIKGEMKKAEALEVQAAEIFKRVAGVEHSDTLNSMNDLAEVLKTRSI